MRALLAGALAVCLLAFLPARSVHAGTKDDASKEAKFAARVKDGITKLGTGPEARVKLELRDKSKLEGYVSDAGESGFVVKDQAGTATTVPYGDVTKVNGNNLRTRWKIVIAAAIVTGIIITLYIVRGAFCDGC